MVTSSNSRLVVDLRRKRCPSWRIMMMKLMLCLKSWADAGDWRNMVSFQRRWRLLTSSPVPRRLLKDFWQWVLWPKCRSEHTKGAALNSKGSSLEFLEPSNHGRSRDWSSFLYLERSQDGNLLKDQQLGRCWKVVFLSDWHFLALLGHSSTLQPSNRAVGLYLFKMILSSGWLMRRLRHIAFDSKSRPEAVAGTPGCTKSSLQATVAKVSMLKKTWQLLC